MATVDYIPYLFCGLMNNCSHALTKAHFESLMDKNGLGAQPELFIRLEPHRGNKTLSIFDTGIGMTGADLFAIVRTGPKEFAEALHAWSDDTSLIDQSGVSFYSAYLVVEKVIVTTKHKDADQQSWESRAGGSFTITKDVNGEQLGRGTKITLFLKEDQLEYLEEGRIKDLVNKHSEFISYPIYLWSEKTPEPGKDEEGDTVEVSYDWQLINKPKRFEPPKNHLAGHMEMGPTASDSVLCKTIKHILGDKVVKVVIAPDLSSCRITRKRVLEINSDNDKLKKLKKMVENEQNDGSVKDLVESLFKSATKPKKALWGKVAKGLTVCCGIIHVATAAISCIMSASGGDA